MFTRRRQSAPARQRFYRSKPDSFVRPTMVIAALIEFLYWDLLRVRGLSTLRRAVVGTTTRQFSSTDADSVVKGVTRAVSIACACYVKRAHCLQRSTAITRMLRRRGLAAQVVIGYQPTPIRSHAWVELNRVVVADNTYGLEHYRVIDRW